VPEAVSLPELAFLQLTRNEAVLLPPAVDTVVIEVKAFPPPESALGAVVDPERKANERTMSPVAVALSVQLVAVAEHWPVRAIDANDGAAEKKK
jgi:hypothetical protein